MSVTINDLILLSGAGVDETSLGSVFSFNADPGLTDLVDVFDGVLFIPPEGTSGDRVPIGSTAEINGQTFTLTSAFNMAARYTKIDPETGEPYTSEGQTLGLTLTAEDGSTISFLSPSLLTTRDPGWLGGNILSIEITTPPTPETGIEETVLPDGSLGGNKLGDDGDVTIPCFVAGTLIDTAEGRKPVEDIRPGDMVLTRDNGFMPITWVGARHISGAELAATPDFRAVMIRAGALGHGLPECDMRVSPWHRVLICGQHAELLFGEYEVLVPAIMLVGQPGITRDSADVTYVHVMFATHQIIRGDGAWSESFQPGQKTLDGMSQSQRDELLALFPELTHAEGQSAYQAARMTLTEHEVRALLAA